jgi:hypothetical protein
MSLRGRSMNYKTHAARGSQQAFELKNSTTLFQDVSKLLVFSGRGGASAAYNTVYLGADGDRLRLRVQVAVIL